jgi:hypothetical protein
MAQTAPVFANSSQFDDFLHASIGEDDHGMLLSVLSALARLGLDPWQEAAKLAQLPVESATRKLAGLLAALPRAQPDAGSHPDAGSPDAGTVAARLIGLLPGRARMDAAPDKTRFDLKTVTKPTAVVVFLIVMAIMVLTQFVMR